MINNPTMQDVLRQFYSKYLDVYTPNERQAKAARHILNCKIGAYGANISKCEQCGHIQYHNNSCRDRSCPIWDIALPRLVQGLVHMKCRR